MSETEYCYCFIKYSHDIKFDVIGMGGSSNVHTVRYRDIAAVVSDSRQGEYEVSKENVTCHESVLSTVLKDFTVLPVGFGCVARDIDQIKEKVIKPNYNQLHQLLEEMDGKIELALKALWKDNQILQQEVFKADPVIKKRWDKLIYSRKKDFCQAIPLSNKLGRGLLSAIKNIKEHYRDRLLVPLDEIALDKRLKKIYHALMIFNIAFLVNRDKEGEFDTAIDKLDQEYGKDIKFMYTGPLAPYSFVDLYISIE